MSKGFTLVELLVVIAIIGILSSIGMVTYQAVNKNSRDSKRQADLKIIQGALEQYNSDQFFYPTAILFGSANSMTSCSGNPTSPPCPTPTPPATLKTYYNQMPSDPIASPDYSYVALSATPPTVCNNTTVKCVSYCLYAKMEGTPPTSASSCSPASPYNFGVAPP